MKGSEDLAEGRRRPAARKVSTIQDHFWSAMVCLLVCLLVHLGVNLLCCHPAGAAAVLLESSRVTARLTGRRHQPPSPRLPVHARSPLASSAAANSGACGPMLIVFKHVLLVTT